MTARFKANDPCSRWAFLPLKRRKQVIDVISSYTKFLAEEEEADEHFVNFVEVSDLWMTVDALRHLGAYGQVAGNKEIVYFLMVEMIKELRDACYQHLLEHGLGGCPECFLYRPKKDLCWMGAVKRILETGEWGQ